MISIRNTIIRNEQCLFTRSTTTISVANDEEVRIRIALYGFRLIDYPFIGIILKSCDERQRCRCLDSSSRNRTYPFISLHITTHINVIRGVGSQTGDGVLLRVYSQYSCICNVATGGNVCHLPFGNSRSIFHKRELRCSLGYHLEFEVLNRKNNRLILGEYDIVDIDALALCSRRETQTLIRLYGSIVLRQIQISHCPISRYIVDLCQCDCLCT